MTVSRNSLTKPSLPVKAQPLAPSSAAPLGGDGAGRGCAYSTSSASFGTIGVAGGRSM